MKKVLMALALAALSATTFCGTVLAAEYTLTWQNNMSPGNANACEIRKITGYSITGSDIVIQNTPKALQLSSDNTKTITTKISYSQPLACSKIILDTFCAVKAYGSVQETLQAITINPCKDSTLKVTDDGILVQ